jgi:multidrug efflux pump subunit AcrA (membrane-fusion protein)
MALGQPQFELEPTSTAAWEEIEAALDELARLARSAVTRSELHSKLLERLVGMLAAVGGAVWDVPADQGGVAIECQMQLDHSLAGDRHEFARHQQLAAAVAAAREPRLIPPAFRDAELANASPWLAILCPVVSEGRTIAVVEIFQRPAGRGAIEDGYLRLVRTACDLAEEFHRAGALAALREQYDELKSLAEFQRQIHRHLDLPQAAAAIANEARRVLGCDRVSVLVRRGRGAQVAAISDVGWFDRRSGVVVGLECVARLLLSSAETLWFPDQADDLPAEIAGPLESLLDEAHSRRIGFLPLRGADGDEGAAIGLLCVERFLAAMDAALPRRAESVAGVCGPALAHALAYERIPLRRALERAAAIFRPRNGSRWPTAAVAGIVLAAVGAGLGLIPADLTVEARGQLMPQRRQQAFAPSDGVVVELPLEEGSTVQAGTRIVQLHSPALEIQQSEILGKQRTAQEELAAAETAALRSDFDSPGAHTRGQLTARVEQLKAEEKSLAAQLAILRQQQTELEVKSPLSGVIITWDAERQLAGRPVKRGDALMMVADLTGPWELVLDVPDRSAGPVLAARRATGELPVTFQLGTDPGRILRGKITTVSPATELSAEAQPAVRVTAQLDDPAAPHFRPGATVVARLHCGRRSLGYVWLHGLWEAIRLRLFV